VKHTESSLENLMNKSDTNTECTREITVKIDFDGMGCECTWLA
jgi:hypothetical protein